MEKELNLVELLKDAPKGTKLYSPIFGECELKEINADLIYVAIKDSCGRIFFEDGSYYGGGECLLFPSKENRDWSTFKVKEEGLKVGDYVKEKDSNNVFKIKEQDNYLVTLTTILADSPEIERKISPVVLDIYEKVEKFDPKWLRPFDRVLVRCEINNEWFATLFSHLSDRYIFTGDACSYKSCVPYNEGTKHLVGTADTEPEFYKID